MLRHGNYVIKLQHVTFQQALPIIPVVIIMLIRVKHIPVVIYNIKAMQIKLISCADISEI